MAAQPPDNDTVILGLLASGPKDLDDMIEAAGMDGVLLPRQETANRLRALSSGPSPPIVKAGRRWNASARQELAIWALAPLGAVPRERKLAVLRELAGIVDPDRRVVLQDIMRGLET